jgi:hypothetical protein
MDLPFRSASRLGVHLEALSIPVFRQVHPRLAFELRRARRYEHPLSVIILRPHGHGDGHIVGSHGGMPAIAPQREREPLSYLLLGSYLRNNLRETDLLVSAPERLLFAAFLPETDEQGARMAVRRLIRGLSQFGAFGVRAGVAEFPRDALTVEDLFEHASQACDGAEPELHPLREMENSRA